MVSLYKLVIIYTISISQTYSPVEIGTYTYQLCHDIGKSTVEAFSRQAVNKEQFKGLKRHFDPDVMRARYTCNPAGVRHE